MKKLADITVLAGLGSLVAGAAVAGVPIPAPLLGAGPVGLAVLAVAGGGYLAVRTLRKRR